MPTLLRQAVALGAAVYAGMLSGEVPGRVLQPWQAKLGRLLEGRSSPFDALLSNGAAEGGDELAEEWAVPFSEEPSAPVE